MFIVFRPRNASIPLDDDMVKHTASRRNGHVVFLIDGGQISKATLDSGRERGNTRAKPKP